MNPENGTGGGEVAAEIEPRERKISGKVNLRGMVRGSGGQEKAVHLNLQLL